MSASITNKSKKPIEVNVSLFDQVNAALIALILLIGFLVTVLFFDLADHRLRLFPQEID